MRVGAPRNIAVDQVVVATGMSTTCMAFFILWLPISDLYGVFTAMAAATITSLTALRRWLPTRRDMFEHGYACGWADAVNDGAPLAVVRPLHPVG